MKYTWGQHFDAWNRFSKWYWRYTLRPSLTNPFRRLWFRLGLTHKREEIKLLNKLKEIFYADGAISSHIGSPSGSDTRLFKEWWKENGDSRGSLDGRIAANIKSLRDLIRDKKATEKNKKK